MAGEDKYYGPWLAQPVARSADFSFHGQTAAIGATSLTGANLPLGLWRVSLLHTINTAGTSGQIQLQVQAYDENSVLNTYSLPYLLVNEVGFQAASFVFGSGGNNPATYQVIFTGVTAGTLAYSGRIVLEQLSALS